MRMHSFRLQLTAWYVLFFTLLLAGFSGFLYFLLEHNLLARVDASLAGTAQTLATLFDDELVEANGNAEAAATEMVRELHASAYVGIFENGRLLDAAGPLRHAASPLVPGVATLPGFGAHGARMIASPFRWNARTFMLLAVEPLDMVAGQLDALRHVFYIALPLAILIAGLGGFVLASRSIAPLTAISEQAEAITHKSLHTRLNTPGARLEFARLVFVFNQLLGRLDRSFESMREFMADASHELRTPLSIIRGEADVALAHERQPDEYRESLAIIQDEARRLTRLVEDLLNLARADAGHNQLQVEDLYLNDLLEECCRSAQAQARQRGVRLLSRQSQDIPFRGDPQLLRRLIANLLDNAIRYTPPDGQVEAGLEIEEGSVALRVADTGVGIPPDALEKIFERFYRFDKSRSRAEGGFGLGLAIVKWIVDAHQGSIDVRSRQGEGTSVTVRLPRVADPASPPVAALAARERGL